MKFFKRPISSSDEKGKAAIIDEGTRPLDGQFCKAASCSTNDDSATHDTTANASNPNPQGTAPRVLTDRELLLSLHQKVDRNHKWSCALRIFLGSIGGVMSSKVIIGGIRCSFAKLSIQWTGAFINSSSLALLISSENNPFEDFYWWQVAEMILKVSLVMN